MKNEDKVSSNALKAYIVSQLDNLGYSTLLFLCQFIERMVALNDKFSSRQRAKHVPQRKLVKSIKTTTIH